MFAGRLRIVALVLVSLASVAAAGMGGPPGDEPPRPRLQSGSEFPVDLVREHARQLRARAEEARQLAERLQREADELDRLAMGRPDRGQRPGDVDRPEREAVEIREVIRRTERDGRREETIEVWKNAERPDKERMPPEGGPRLDVTEEMRGHIERLSSEARRAKEQGRLEESERLWNEARNVERELGRQREIRGMMERIESMHQKAAMLRERAERAAREGRPEEAQELRRNIGQLEREIEAGNRKVERFRVESQLKDLRMMTQEAKQRGDHPKAEALSREAQALERHLQNLSVEPGQPPRGGDVMAVVEELKREIERLRLEMDEIRRQLGEKRPM